MTFQTASKLELNVLNSNSKSDYIANFLIKNRIPAVVVAPDYVAPLSAHRAALRGSYKIICAIDFPSGANFALDKVYRSNPDLSEADGYDILISTGRTEIETRNEMKALHEFLRMNRPMCEIRWCLKQHTHPDEAIKALGAMAKFSPTFVRVDPHLTIPKVGLKQHLENLKVVRKHVPFAIKVGGNIDFEMLEKLQEEKQVKRFDVNLVQAEAILRQAKTPVAEVAPQKEAKGPAVKEGKHHRIRLK